MLSSSAKPLRNFHASFHPTFLNSITPGPPSQSHFHLQKDNMLPAPFAHLVARRSASNTTQTSNPRDLCKKLSKADIALQNRPIRYAGPPLCGFRKVIKSYHPKPVGAVSPRSILHSSFQPIFYLRADGLPTACRLRPPPEREQAPALQIGVPRALNLSEEGG
jgi:hypothetical protein